MRYQIIARRMSPAQNHDYRDIVEVQYRVGNDIASCRRDQMIRRLERGDTAYVSSGQAHAEVGVFDLNASKTLRRSKYLRSYDHDDRWDDTLLTLPAF